MTRLNKSGRERLGTALLVLWLGVALTGCEGFLDVDNPNNVVGDDLVLPEAASAVSNGALYSVMAGYTYVLMDHATVSDELIWIGSRDAFQKLEQGYANDPLNEFTDQGFREWAPARWMCDEAISILETHLGAGDLADPTDLSRAYLWGAFTYLSVADMFDDWALSDRKFSGRPVGEAGMGAFYTTAINYLTAGLALTGVSGTTLERNLLAMRARARHAQGVWNLVGVRPISPGTGLLSAADAAAAGADARDALAATDGSGDWAFQLDYNAASAFGDGQYAINERLEVRFSDVYIIPDQETGKVRCNATDEPVRCVDGGAALQDPIDAKGDPRIDAFMDAFETGASLADITVVSARYMHLILAEDALVNGTAADGNNFAYHINMARGWGSLTDWTAGSGVSETDMLIYERQANLLFMGVRLNDMYRFGISSPTWHPTAPAATNPGTFLPITKAEIDSNCFINPDWPTDVPCEEPGG